MKARIVKTKDQITPIMKKFPRRLQNNEKKFLKDIQFQSVKTAKSNEFWRMGGKKGPPAIQSKLTSRTGRLWSSISAFIRGKTVTLSYQGSPSKYGSILAERNKNWNPLQRALIRLKPRMDKMWNQLNSKLWRP